MRIYVGCAGWTLRRDRKDSFPATGTHLERYSQRFNCVEVNSSFYRSHQTKTYQRWAESTPSNFQFSVKLPKQITHVQRLIDVETLIAQFATEIHGLGEKLGPVLVQLPPSLKFNLPLATNFFGALRSTFDTPLVCEPRHPSWFDIEAEILLREYSIGRVAADPVVVPEAASPGGCKDSPYFRLHGSPRVYYSAYSATALEQMTSQILEISEAGGVVWCIFDNTAEGAALDNALEVNRRLVVDRRVCSDR